MQESAPPYDDNQSGASGLVPGKPLVGPASRNSLSPGKNNSSLADRPPPPLPSVPPNSGGSSPAGKSVGSSPAKQEDSGIYDYATTPSPLNRGFPGGSYHGDSSNGGLGRLDFVHLHNVHV